MNNYFKNFKLFLPLTISILMVGLLSAQPRIGLRMTNAVRTGPNTLTWDIEIRNSGTGTINYENGSINTLTTTGALPAGTLAYVAGLDFPGLSFAPVAQISGGQTRFRLNAQDPINIPLSSSFQKLATVTFTSGMALPLTQIFARLNQLDVIPRIEITGRVGLTSSTYSIANSNLDIESLNNILFPVKLVDFSAEKAGERRAKLYWSSASEINTSHFTIEKSEDALNFKPIGEVKAAGNSNTILDYDFYDEKVLVGRSNTIVYYRLKMVDLDGTFEYSDTRGVNFESDQTYGVIMYPNPTSSLLNLDINKSSFTEENAEVQVFDAVGQLIFAKKVIGTGIETIDMGRMTNGVYHVVFTQGDQIFREKIVKID
ncbi:MAG: T9SS type A sorting domain-containing protein [Saprospiraceae bacterium]|nr:T9SS type A sorting domain-containing protein [Saprospiraceae bacterium]MBK8817913.1 T9SS type A sorting domain-containing protein [Saprospiraceae bacterium]